MIRGEHGIQCILRFPVTSALVGTQTRVHLQSLPELTHSYYIVNTELEKFVCLGKLNRFSSPDGKGKRG